MINGRNFFDQLVKNYLKTYNNIRQIATGQGDDYPTGYLIYQVYQFITISKKYYKSAAIDLSEQQKLDADPKAIQQINFIGNLSRAQGEQCFSLLQKRKKQFQIIQKEQLKYMVLFHFDII